MSKSITPEDDKRCVVVCPTSRLGKRRRTSKLLSTLGTNQLSEEDSNNIIISDDTQELALPTLTSDTQKIQAISATNQSGMILFT